MAESAQVLEEGATEQAGAIQELSENPPSIRRQWMCGFHSRGRPKV